MRSHTPRPPATVATCTFVGVLVTCTALFTVPCPPATAAPDATTVGAAAQPAAAEAGKTAAAETGKPPMGRVPDAGDRPVVTEHAITIEGRQVAYRAEAGMLPLLKDDGAAKASVFYVAYTLAPTPGPDGTAIPPDPGTRPLLFCFNGGPGASAVWLHLGGLGPRRAVVNDDGTLPAPPFRLVDNQSSILPVADLVFIDPVATGYSRPARDEKAEQFFGRDPDIKAIAEFIRLYTTRHARWRSPKYLCGESYGVFRAAGLASELQDEHGMFLSGLVLVSGLVDFETIRPAPCNDLPYALFLPSFTAVAHHHRRLPADLQRQDAARVVAEARAFAAGEYASALFAGASLSAARREEVAAALARLTGLPPDVVLRHDLRVEPEAFRKQLLASEGLICGRFDGRITGRDGDPAAAAPGFDPSFTAALGPLAGMMNAYVREELRFESDLPYRVLAGVRPWSYEQNAYASTSRELADALAKNPHLRVLVQVGLCDLAVPGDSMRHSVDHLRLAPELRGNVTFAEYASGHMMYLNLPDLQKLRTDLGAFLR